MSRIVVGLLIFLAGCGAQQNIGSRRSSSGSRSEAEAAREITAWDAACQGMAPEGMEAIINVVQEAQRDGVSREHLFGDVISGLSPDLTLADFTYAINCLDAILDEVYGPG